VNMPESPLKRDWRDPNTINAARAYVYLAITLGLSVVFIYMFIVGKLDLEAVIKAINALLIVNFGGQGLISWAHVNARNNDNT
jgi:hypothetical protein